MDIFLFGSGVVLTLAYLVCLPLTLYGVISLEPSNRRSQASRRQSCCFPGNKS